MLARNSDVFPLMLVMDLAANQEERMTESALAKSQELDIRLGVGVLYTSPNN